jgi:hypothetical protein
MTGSDHLQGLLLLTAAKPPGLPEALSCVAGALWWADLTLTAAAAL